MRQRILHGQPFSVFAKLSAATDACGHFTAELAGLRLLSQAARVPAPLARGLAELPHGWPLPLSRPVHHGHCRSSSR